MAYMRLGDLLIAGDQNSLNAYSIENDSTGGALEIWIKPEGEETPLVFYLFPYDQGVVYYG